jgi:hypothetical protein
MYQSFKRPKHKEKPNLGSDDVIPFKEVLLNEDTEKTETDNQDLLRRRLLSLKAVMKTPFFFKCNGQTITENDLKEEVPDITPNEICVCILLTNILLVYVPAKANYHQVAFQLLYFAVIDLCPISGHGSLHSLRMIVVLFYPKKRKKNEDDQMTIFDFEGYAINSTQRARKYKYTAFNSLFDIKAIYNVCRLKGLEFAYNLVYLPGLKSVRILGSKAVTKTPPPHTEKYSSNENCIKDLPWGVIQ